MRKTTSSDSSEGSERRQTSVFASTWFGGIVGGLCIAGVAIAFDPSVVGVALGAVGFVILLSLWRLAIAAYNGPTGKR
jgi:hypothetical protein